MLHLAIRNPLLCRKTQWRNTLFCHLSLHFVHCILFLNTALLFCRCLECVCRKYNCGMCVSRDTLIYTVTVCAVYGMLCIQQLLTLAFLTHTMYCVQCVLAVLVTHFNFPSPHAHSVYCAYWPSFPSSAMLMNASAVV